MNRVVAGERRTRDQLLEVVMGLESLLHSSIAPGPRIDYAWQLGLLADNLIDYVCARDEASCAEDLCEEHPWLSDSIDPLTARQLERIGEARRIARQSEEVNTNQELERLVGGARRMVEEICRLQAKKEVRLRRAGSGDLGEGD